ncbi:MAG TPA: class I SAM-dependent methyltransferase [Burkholderiales bacterium]|nr:class I SAM-dependent methyltransferase [Burkholderiales bacterium]
MLMRWLCLLSCVLASRAWAQMPPFAWDDGTVPYVNTPMEVVERMLILGEVKAGDRVIDLGSGDGRIVIEAAKRGASGLGVDLDPTLVKLAKENAAKAGVAERARFEVRDIFETDLSGATVVTMYLLPEFNAKLLERFLKLKPGTRIVSHDGGIGDWPPDESWTLRTPEKPVGIGGNSRIDLWIVPPNVAGNWTSELPQHGGAWRFHVSQHYQMLEVDAQTGGRELVVRNTRLRGEELKLVVTGMVGARAWHHYFVGRVRGDAIDGEITVSDGNREIVYPWHATRAR